MTVGEKNLETARTAVPLLYRQHNLVISAKTSEMQKAQQAEPPVTQELRYTHSTLNDKCRKLLAGDALHIA
jgi:hypothetical protein